MEAFRIKPYSEYTDFGLASAYFNRIQYMSEEELKNEVDDFWAEVGKRRGEMFPLEWLDYHY